MTQTQPSPIPQLPLEVLSHITSLLAPPFHAPPSTSTASTGKPAAFDPNPPWYLIQALDPAPAPPHNSLNSIASTSRASHRLLEASRPWLWEDVDVKSGRGWLAIVNALTEEVVDEVDASLHDVFGNTPLLSSNGFAGQIPPVTPTSPDPRLEAIPASDAHVQPNTIPGGYAQYMSPPPSAAYPSPYTNVDAPHPVGLAIRVPVESFPYSPPQPAYPSELLTPPGSRNASPHICFSPQPKTTPPSLPSLPSLSSVASVELKSSISARLRGRSRSPRRSIGFDTEGISAVLERSRSASARGLRASSSGGSWPRRLPLERRTSLSRSRTMSDRGYDEGDEADEEDDEVAPLPERGRGRAPMLSPPLPTEGQDEIMDEDEEDNLSNAGPEHLPPPGPYIRHISFNNFRTIGSRRTQDEAVRGRFVTAGRLEGVIKVCFGVSVWIRSDVFGCL